MTLSANVALLLIDVQQGLDDPRWGERNNPDSPLRPERPGNGLKPEVLPQRGEKLFQKTVNSAFIGTALEAHLRAQQIQTVVVVGLTTDHCVSSTTRMTANLGFTAIVVSDGTATFERTGPDGGHHSAEQVLARTVPREGLLAKWAAGWMCSSQRWPHSQMPI